MPAWKHFSYKGPAIWSYDVCFLGCLAKKLLNKQSTWNVVTPMWLHSYELLIYICIYVGIGYNISNRNLFWIQVQNKTHGSRTIYQEYLYYIHTRLVIPTYENKESDGIISLYLSNYPYSWPENDCIDQFIFEFATFGMKWCRFTFDFIGYEFLSIDRCWDRLDLIWFL